MRLDDFYWQNALSGDIEKPICLSAAPDTFGQMAIEAVENGQITEFELRESDDSDKVVDVLAKSYMPSWGPFNITVSALELGTEAGETFVPKYIRFSPSIARNAGEGIGLEKPHLVISLDNEDRLVVVHVLTDKMYDWTLTEGRTTINSLRDSSFMRDLISKSLVPAYFDQFKDWFQDPTTGLWIQN